MDLVPQLSVAALQDSIDKMEQVDAALWYNLGTLYLQEEQWAKARLNLERAHIAAPKNKDINTNLKYCIEKIELIPTKVQPFVLVRAWDTLSQWLQAQSWAWLSLLAWATLLYFLYLYWNKGGNKSSRFGMIICLGVGLLTTFLSITRHHAMNDTQACIVMEESPLYQEVNGEELEKLSAGKKVFVIQEDANWALVKKENLEEGWITTKGLQRIIE